MIKAGKVVALLIGALTALYLFRYTSSSLDTYQLLFPPDKHLAVTLSGTLSYQEQQLSGEILDHQFRIQAEIKGTPQVIGEDSLYRCQLEALTVTDVDEQLVVAFQKLEDGEMSYRIIPNGSEEERANLYQLLQIDYTNESALDDHSLLRETLAIYASKQGRILEIRLSPKLKDLLSLATMRSKGAPLIHALANQPDRLPPLLDGKGMRNEWTTSGHFLEPLTFSHRLQATQGKTLKVTTSGNAEITKRPAWNQSWQMDWTVSTETKTLDSLRLQAQFTRSRLLLNATEGVTCHIDTMATFRYGET